MLASQDAELPHLGHCNHELLEEQRLVERKAFDDFLCLTEAVQILIRREKSLAVKEIDVVLVVKDVGGSDILNGEGVGIIGRTYDLEVLGEGLVHDRVLVWVEAITKGGAVGNADGVASREGDNISSVKVFSCERVEDGAGTT